MEHYDFPRSSASYRVRIALNLKGLDVDRCLIDFGKNQQKSPEYLKISPSGLVPVLVDGDNVVSQSLSIIQYLDSNYPGYRLIPLDPSSAMRVHELAYIICCDIHPLNNLRVLKYLETEVQASQEDRQAWYSHWIQEGFKGLEAKVSACRGEFCYGDQVTLADVCLVPQLFNARRFNVDLNDFPNLVEIDERCQLLEPIANAKPT